MKKRITDKSNPLTVDETYDKSNLRFESLNIKKNEEITNGNNQEVVFLEANLREHIEIVL
jgi:hypothetical protein